MNTVANLDDKEIMDIKRGLVIAMHTLDEKQIDQDLCDRLEEIFKKL